MSQRKRLLLLADCYQLHQRSAYVLIHINSLCQFSTREYSMTKTHKKLYRSSMDFHLDELLKCCRVCGKRLKTSRGCGRAISCHEHHTELLDTFEVDTRSDDSDTHPPQFCFSCYGVVRRKAAAAKKGLPYTSPALQSTFQWTTHTDNSCHVRKVIYTLRSNYHKNK